MLIALLSLAAGSPQAVAISAPVMALFAERSKLGDPALVAGLISLSGTGDVTATEALGELYLLGSGNIAQDRPKACGYFERTAGFRADGANNLALCYENGWGRSVDLSRARELYRIAADRGWVQAKCALGNLMIDGKGGPRQEAEGLALCKSAAEAGNANAQTDYANRLLLGQGTPRDVVAARLWYQRAAEQNQPNAAFVLAQINWNGDGTPTDASQAERWWRVAYQYGRKDAAIWVSNALFKRMAPDGRTITDHSLKADWLRWLQIAAREDPDPAKRKDWERLLQAPASAAD